MSSVIHRGHSNHQDETEALEEILDQVKGEDLSGLICFASSDYDADRLAKAISERFNCPILACTTAGEIGEAYGDGGVSAMSFERSHFDFHAATFPDVLNISASSIKTKIDPILQRIQEPRERTFAISLIDGLSMAEEQFVASTHRMLNGIPLVGGSAGDSLRFKETRVFGEDGRFHSGAGAIGLINSKVPFEIFKFQHFVPSEIEMVVTEADPQKRIVTEIDGLPAAAEYARLVGLNPEQLSPTVFSRYPVMLEIGDEWYVRSIQKVNDDGSLSFFCAIDDGLVLTVARGSDYVSTLADMVSKLEGQFDTIHATLGFDCILRRLEMLEKGLIPEVEDLVRRIELTGFSTFGEQFNSVHVNQTLTGVCLGERSP